MWGLALESLVSKEENVQPNPMIVALLERAVWFAEQHPDWSAADAWEAAFDEVADLAYWTLSRAGKFQTAQGTEAVALLRRAISLL